MRKKKEKFINMEYIDVGYIEIKKSVRVKESFDQRFFQN